MPIFRSKAEILRNEVRSYTKGAWPFQGNFNFISKIETEGQMISPHPPNIVNFEVNLYFFSLS